MKKEMLELFTGTGIGTGIEVQGFDTPYGYRCPNLFEAVTALKIVALSVGQSHPMIEPGHIPIQQAQLLVVNIRLEGDVAVLI